MEKTEKQKTTHTYIVENFKPELNRKDGIMKLQAFVCQLQ